MHRPDDPSDRLDAALDGRPVEVDGDLAPLIETAAKLRGALEANQLDPEAIDRHLAMVLNGEATVVPLPTLRRPRIGRWRRRVATVALAAALAVLPATMASASALPGQPLYPVKLAVERLQVAAVSWSSSWEAGERIKIVDSRQDELDRLVRLNAADRIPPAIAHFEQAYEDAEDAVDAVGDSGSGQARALEARLEGLRRECAGTLHRLRSKLDQGMLPASARKAIIDAIQQAAVTTPGVDKGIQQPTLTTGTPLVTTPTGSQTSQASTTTQMPTTTTEASTTTQGSTTTEAPITTAPPEVSDSPDQGGNDDSGQGSSGETATTLP